MLDEVKKACGKKMEQVPASDRQRWKGWGSWSVALMKGSFTQVTEDSGVQCWVASLDL